MVDEIYPASCDEIPVTHSVLMWPAPTPSVTRRRDKRAPRPLRSVEGAPVASVAGHQASSDEQDEIHEPPDPQASESQELPNGGARVTQAEAVDAKAAQEEGVQQRGDEVVTRVSVETMENCTAQHISHWSRISPYL